MREIKFRVWDKKNKEMISHTKLFRLDTSNEMPFLPLLEKFTTDYVVREYTGLKDKNGLEIYEGDIVEQLSERTYESVKGTVKFVDGSYVIEFLSGDNGVFLFDEVAYNEVLGNVYENPILLEESQNESK